MSEYSDGSGDGSDYMHVDPEVVQQAANQLAGSVSPG